MDTVLCWFEQHPGLASWIQAAGSLLALVIAIGVMHWQHRAAKAEAASQKREHVEQVFDAVLAYSSHAVHELVAAHKGLIGPDTADFIKSYDPEFMSSFIQAGRSIPIFELPNHDSIVEALRLRDAIESAPATYRKVVQTFPEGGFEYDFAVSEILSLAQFLSGKADALMRLKAAFQKGHQV